MNQIDSSHIAVEFMQDNIVSRQFEFITAIKRSLAIALCQCSSLVAVACQVKQSIQGFNQSAIYEFAVKVEPKVNQMLVQDDYG